MLLWPMAIGKVGLPTRPDWLSAIGKVGNCKATPVMPENCHTFVNQPKRSLHNQYLLASYGALRYDYPPFDEILTPAGCKRNDTRWDVNGAGYGASPAALGIAPCRSQPHWCPLPAADAADAPLQTHGTVPCVLSRRCPGFHKGFQFHPAPAPDGDGARAPGQQRTLECLRDKVIVFLGDSVMRELFTEWALWLGTNVLGFNTRWLTNDFKQQVKDATTPTTRHSIGPLEVFFKLYNQDVSLTDHRLNLTIKFRTATHFNWTSGESTAGLRYWQSADFRQELENLGVHPMAPLHGVDPPPLPDQHPHPPPIPSSVNSITLDPPPKPLRSH